MNYGEITDLVCQIMTISSITLLKWSFDVCTSVLGTICLYRCRFVCNSDSRTQMSWTEGNYNQGYPFEDYMETLLGKGTRTPYDLKHLIFLMQEHI